MLFLLLRPAEVVKVLFRRRVFFFHHSSLSQPWTRPPPLGCALLLAIGFASTACVIVNLRDNWVALAGAAVAAAAVAAEAAALSGDEFQFAKRVCSGAWAWRGRVQRLSQGVNGGNWAARPHQGGYWSSPRNQRLE